MKTIKVKCKLCGKIIKETEVFCHRDKTGHNKFSPLYEAQNTSFERLKTGGVVKS
jgi:hypothetical protein